MAGLEKEGKEKADSVEAFNAGWSPTRKRKCLDNESVSWSVVSDSCDPMDCSPSGSSCLIPFSFEFLPLPFFHPFPTVSVPGAFSSVIAILHVRITISVVKILLCYHQQRLGSTVELRARPYPKTQQILFKNSLGRKSSEQHCSGQ